MKNPYHNSMTKLSVFFTIVAAVWGMAFFLLYLIQPIRNQTYTVTIFLFRLLIQSIDFYPMLIMILFSAIQKTDQLQTKRLFPCIMIGSRILISLIAVGLQKFNYIRSLNFDGTLEGYTYRIIIGLILLLLLAAFGTRHMYYIFGSVFAVIYTIIVFCALLNGSNLLYILWGLSSIAWVYAVHFSGRSLPQKIIFRSKQLLSDEID